MADKIKWAMTLNGKKDPQGHRMIAGLIKGAINNVQTGYLEFAARDKKLDLGDLVGTEMGFWVEDENGKKQHFWGTCVSAEAKGVVHSEGIYVAEIRPWLWFLTRSQNNRIYQNKKTTDIVKDILGDYGFSADLKISHSGTDPEREYCVQYRESDLNFIKRLLEEEGFYFYFEHDGGSVKMVLADQPSAHPAATADEKYEYGDESAKVARERITVWKAVEQAVTGKVTLRDYDFTKPNSDLTASSMLASGSHAHKTYESYQYPGGYTDVSDGERRAGALIEEQASGHQVWSAAGTMLNLNVGSLFEIKNHPRHSSASVKGFMVTRITQILLVGDTAITGGSALLNAFGKIVDEGDPDAVGPAGGFGAASDALSGFCQTVFEAVLKSKPYRGPGKTPRPDMIGIQTAIVTGASGDEISVDEYGRIKIQFHWDRQGKKDDKTTCWVRTVMPWTGKNWGMIGLPRVGQEVVIQFLEGDPDRPVCTGMLYNADTMPPYELPGNATRTGIKTNSSKGGGGYNELMFEDKKGDELLRFMAEKDFVQNVQNQSHITVGYDHKTDVKKAEAQADKSMKLEVQKHLDEIVETGDHSFEVKAGKQDIKIKKDKTEKVDGSVKLTVNKDMKAVVSTGNVTEQVKMGNKSTKVDMGNIEVKASLGKIEMEAMQSIELKVGANSVKIDQMGVTIKGIMVKVEGTAMLNASAPLTEVKGTGMLILQGTLTKIN